MNRRRRNRLGWPASWEEAYRRAASRWMLPACVLLACAYLGWSMLTWKRSAGFFVLSSTMILFLLTAKGYLVTVFSRRRGASGIQLAKRHPYNPPSVFLPFPKPVVLTGTLLAACTLITSVTYLSYANTIPAATSRLDARLSIVGSLAAVFIILMSAFLIVRLARWRRPLGLAISPDGVYHWSWFGGKFLHWNDLLKVSAITKSGPSIDLKATSLAHSRRTEESWLCRFGFFRRYMCTIHAGYLAVDPAIAYYGILFYLKNPDHRHELATDVGVERLRRMDFPPSLAEELSDSAKA